MKCLVTSARPYDRDALDQANESRHELTYVEASLSRETAGMARGFAAVCPFVDDCLDAEMIDILFQGGTRLLALRSTGYNHVDLSAASRHGMAVMRVKEYSPHSVAEFAVGDDADPQPAIASRVGSGSGRKFSSRWPSGIRYVWKDRRDCGDREDRIGPGPDP